MINLDKYNELVEQGREIDRQMHKELKACGIVEVLHECIDTGDFTEVIGLIKQMEDSVTKAYIKRKLRLDHGVEFLRRCSQQ